MAGIALQMPPLLRPQLERAAAVQLGPLQRGEPAPGARCKELYQRLREYPLSKVRPAMVAGEHLGQHSLGITNSQQLDQVGTHLPDVEVLASPALPVEG